MSEWISVKDRIPSLNQMVIAFLLEPNDSSVEIGMLMSAENTPDDWWFTNDRTFGGTVTHWMPLPKPPEEV